MHRPLSLLLVLVVAACSPTSVDESNQMPIRRLIAQQVVTGSAQTIGGVAGAIDRDHVHDQIEGLARSSWTTSELSALSMEYGRTEFRLKVGEEHLAAVTKLLRARDFEGARAAYEQSRR